MVKKSILFLSLCATLATLIVALLERNDHICFGNGYGIVSLNGEFQTIFHEVTVDHLVMNNRVLRGKVVSYAYAKESGILAGELDVSVLRNEYLSDLIEIEDKDGFFIINTKTRSAISGLEKSDYVYHVKKLTGDDLEPKSIGYLDRLYWNCL